MNHPGKKNLLHLCSWQNLAGRRQNGLGIIYNRPSPILRRPQSRATRIPFLPRKSKPQDLCPPYQLQSHCAKAVPGKETGIPQPCPLAQASELRDKPGWMQSWPPSLPPAGEFRLHGPWTWSSSGPACVQDSWERWGAGVTTQLDLPSWEGRGNRVQPKPM